MHELSIAQNIIDIATNSAYSHNIKKIVSVEVEVGLASGVVIEALEFAWESARLGTILEEASLVIKPVAIIARCRTCHTEYKPNEIYDECPGCGDVNAEILSGKELRVNAITT